MFLEAARLTGVAGSGDVEANLPGLFRAPLGMHVTV